MKVTVEHKEKHSEDIFTPGKLVIHNHPSIVLLINGHRAIGTDYFSATVIAHDNPAKIGNSDNDWDKGQFKKFVGTITLEQE